MSSRTRRGKLAVDYRFRLNRELRKMKKSVVKYQEKIKFQIGGRRPITQKLVVHELVGDKSLECWCLVSD